MSTPFETVKRIKTEREDDLLARPNVTGVGIGYKEIGGEETDELSVLVTVERKLARDELDSSSIVPPQVETSEGEVQTDVIELGRPLPAQGPGGKRIRPVWPGVSIAGALAPDDYTPDRGALGLFLADGRQVYLISNNHVLCDPKAQQKR